MATGDRRVGRFGWKAQHATLLAFGADAYRNEMGITNDLFPREFAFGIGADQMRLCDTRPDPEDVRNPLTRRRGIDNFESFMRFLAPVARGPVDAIVRDGERIFDGIGCARCHVPALTTGPSVNPLFNRKTVALFSDLLLHDIGTGDGIQQGAAAPEEIRTPALWGLRSALEPDIDGTDLLPTYDLLNAMLKRGNADGIQNRDIDGRDRAHQALDYVLFELNGPRNGHEEK